MYKIYEYGQDEKRKKYIKGMVQGELIGCLGIKEKDEG